MHRIIISVVNDAAFFVSHRLPVALEAKERGYDVHVATPPGTASGEIAAAGLAWHSIPLNRSSRDPLSELRSIIALVQLYGRIKPDLVHHVAAKPALYGTLAARLRGVRAVINALPGLGHVFISDEISYRIVRRIVRAGYRMILRHPRMRMIFQTRMTGRSSCATNSFGRNKPC